MAKKNCVYKNRTGKTGELKAAQFLTESGYKIINTNYKFEKSEIDIICIKDKILIFVEVKTRRNKKFGEPEESITPYKIKNIQKTAEGFILNHPEYENYDLRFDVITLLIDNTIEINHIENAF